MHDRTALARRALAAMDLTSLGEDDTPAMARALCVAAGTPWGAPAALCVHPELVATVREALAAAGLERVAVATVANFPDGAADAGRAVREVRRALTAGADEVDVVFPYRALMAGDAAAGATLLQRCREVQGGRYVLKAILETGMLAEPALVRRAADIAIAAGVDFIKTSTGKVAVNATPAAAQAMLQAIHEHGGSCGFKAAGGIRALDDAAAYFALADRILGPEWAVPARFRLGASRLLDEVLATLAAAAVGKPA